MATQLEEIKKELLKNQSELVSAFLVLVLVVVNVYMIFTGMFENVIRYTTVTTLGAGFIIFIGFEKRSKKFDKYVSMGFVFLLALSFMFL